MRLVGGPADGCEVDGEARVITVRCWEGAPVLDGDGRLKVSSIQPSSARGRWEPYVLNLSAGVYMYAWAVDPPPWYDRFPAVQVSASQVASGARPSV